MRPWDFTEAVTRCSNASVRQMETEDATREAVRRFAEAQEAYDMALALKITELRGQSVPASIVKDAARGTNEVAVLRKAMTLADGEVETMKQAGWRRNADRKDAQRFSDWSERRELAEAYGQTPEPRYDKPIGAGGR